MKYKRAGSFCLMLFVAIATACNSNDEDGNEGNDNDKKVVGILVQTTGNPFFLDLAKAAEEELGDDYTVIVMGGENNADKQAKQIKDLIIQKVDAFLITPCNANAVGAPIREANAVEIPVFTADTACLADDVEIVHHVATDNYQGGKLAGQAMIEALRGQAGKILILDYEQAESCQERVRGFKEVIHAHNQDSKNKDAQINIVAQLPGGADEGASQTQMKYAIKGDRDLVGVFAINDPSAIGAVAAIEEENLQKQIKVIGFDGQKIGKLAIRDGRIFADPIQFPKEMGKRSAQAIKNYFAGEELPTEPEMIAPKLYYQKDALADPELQDEK